MYMYYIHVWMKICVHVLYTKTLYPHIYVFTYSHKYIRTHFYACTHIPNKFLFTQELHKL